MYTHTTKTPDHVHMPAICLHVPKRGSKEKDTVPRLPQVTHLVLLLLLIVVLARYRSLKPRTHFLLEEGTEMKCVCVHDCVYAFMHVVCMCLYVCVCIVCSIHVVRQHESN